MSEVYQIIAVNPGSTSTKVAVFDNDRKRFSVNVSHPVGELKQFQEIVDQLDYRKKTTLNALEEHHVDLRKIDASSGRCTGLLPMTGGVHEVNGLMYRHGSMGIGSKHPGNLGPMIARDFDLQFGSRSSVVNPSSIDEFHLEACLTRLGDIQRTSQGHPLNQKEVAACYVARLGKCYEDINVVVVHMGGGIFVTTHEKGKMVDTADSARGEGRMTPTRTGVLPVALLVESYLSGKCTQKELMGKIMKTGGWTDLLGTADALEVEQRVSEGDMYAKLVCETTGYQVAKDIGAYAMVLCGEVDGILLTRSLTHSQYLVEIITQMTKFIVPVCVFPGEFEMEGLAAGAPWVFRNIEYSKFYAGKPVFRGFHKMGQLA